MRVHPARSRRRGAVAIFTAIMLMMLLVFVALGVDLGYIVLVHAQLQNAADSGALAGASQLMEDSLLQGTPNQANAKATAIDNARAEARRLAQLNYGGGIYLSVNTNTSNDPAGDIVVGYLANPSDRTQAIVPTPGASTNFPNSVQVRVHRDGIRNGSISLFFARTMGITNWDLQATATATLQGGIVGFKYQSSVSARNLLLPFAMQIDVWNQMVAGTGPDDFRRTRPSSGGGSAGTVTDDSDGVKEGKLFPLSNDLSSGNFGMLDIGPPANATPVYENWILNGPSQSDLAYFTAAHGYPNGFKLDPLTGSISLKGTPGVHAAMQSDLQSIIGQARIIPLYSTVTGNGNNAQYTIVGFAGCTVLDVNLQGSLSSKHITIQPCFAIDPTAIAGASGSFAGQYIVKPLGLSR